MFDEKTLKDSQERWEDIIDRADLISDRLTQTPDSSAQVIPQFNKDLACLLLLLVEHLKPMNPTKDQIKEQMDGIGKELADLMGQFKTK